MVFHEDRIDFERKVQQAIQGTQKYHKQVEGDEATQNEFNRQMTLLFIKALEENKSLSQPGAIRSYDEFATVLHELTHIIGETPSGELIPYLVEMAYSDPYLLATLPAYWLMNNRDSLYSSLFMPIAGVRPSFHLSDAGKLEAIAALRRMSKAEIQKRAKELLKFKAPRIYAAFESEAGRQLREQALAEIKAKNGIVEATPVPDLIMKEQGATLQKQSLSPMAVVAGAVAAKIAENPLVTRRNLFGLRRPRDGQRDQAMMGKNDIQIDLVGDAEREDTVKTIDRIKKRLDALQDRGSGWLRVVATPQEAYRFHTEWSDSTSGEYVVTLEKNQYVVSVPLKIWKKMAAWFSKSTTFEMNGYFVGAVKENGRIEVEDFVPQGSLAEDPMGSDSSAQDTRTTQTNTNIGTVIDTDRVAQEFGLDLNLDRELSVDRVLGSREGMIAIPTHSHHLASLYDKGPSDADKNVIYPGELEFVFSNKTGEGYFFTHDETQKVDQDAIQDAAMLSPVGGIDINPNSISIQTEGEGVKFNKAINAQELERLKNIPLDGFSPVIFQIVPIPSVPQLFGVNSKITPILLSWPRQNPEIIFGEFPLNFSSPSC